MGESVYSGETSIANTFQLKISFKVSVARILISSGKIEKSSERYDPKHFGFWNFFNGRILILPISLFEYS